MNENWQFTCGENLRKRRIFSEFLQIFTKIWNKLTAIAYRKLVTSAVYTALPALM